MAEGRGVWIFLPVLRYNPNLKRLARDLRKQSTLAEVLLWRHLKGRQRRDIDFHRQKPIGESIVDFFAPDLMLAVEIDGSSHQLKGTEDLDRQRKLEARGIRFLRFSDREVKANAGGIAQAIDHWIKNQDGNKDGQR